MGYYVQTVSSDLTFKDGVDFDEVLEHVKQEMFTDEMLLKKANGGGWPKEGKSVAEHTWYSWTDTQACRDATHIADIVEQFFRGSAEWADDYSSFTVNVDSKIGQEDVLLETLAPFLTDGSHLHYRGEDGSLFGWEVRNGTLVNVKAIIVWEDA